MRVAIVVGGLLGSLCAIEPVWSQVGFPPPPPKVSPAAGVIDMHVHSHPDVFGRSMDDIDVATLAKAKGMRGIVLKNHVVTTADRAALVMKVVPGIEVWGGIVLNKAVGGINPAAVEWMHRIYGGRGKIVWLPTFDSDKHVKTLVNKDASGDCQESCVRGHSEAAGGELWQSRRVHWTSCFRDAIPTRFFPRTVCSMN